jgi:SPP1 family predicted phage head-tail adaptor
VTAGRRNRRVVFQRFTTTTNDYNEEIEVWADYATAFASVSFGTGQERREAAQETASAPATFQVVRNPLTAALTTRDRISFLGGLWDITSVVPSRDFQRFIDITATRTAD